MMDRCLWTGHISQLVNQRFLFTWTSEERTIIIFLCLFNCRQNWWCLFQIFVRDIKEKNVSVSDKYFTHPLKLEKKTILTISNEKITESLSNNQIAYSIAESHVQWQSDTITNSHDQKQNFASHQRRIRCISHTKHIS